MAGNVMDAHCEVKRGIFRGGTGVPPVRFCCPWTCHSQPPTWGGGSDNGPPPPHVGGCTVHDPVRDSNIVEASREHVFFCW